MLDQGESLQLRLDIGIAGLNMVGRVGVDNDRNARPPGDLAGDVRRGRVRHQIDVLVLDAETVELGLGADAVAAPIGAEHRDGGGGGHTSILPNAA